MENEILNLSGKTNAAKIAKKNENKKQYTPYIVYNNILSCFHIELIVYKLFETF
jgi:hypothetical protein